MGEGVHEEVGEDEEADDGGEDGDLLIGLLRSGRDVLGGHIAFF